MKILYVCRLFTGLEASVAARRWVPAGVPTIFKLIEGLRDSGHDLRLVLTCKDSSAAWPARHDMDLAIDGIPRPVRLLAGSRHLAPFLGRLSGWWRELRQLVAILREVRRERPDLVYIDHANLWAGAVLARFASVPVVFRVMGVYPVMRRALDGASLSHRLMVWCYRAPWRLVVCSEDGSGSAVWLRRALAPDVPWRLLVNGVDSPIETDAATPAIPAGRVVVLFLGKLEPAKGAMEFLDGFLAALTLHADLHALIVGEGGLRETMTSRITDAGAGEHVTMLGRVPHQVVAAVLRRADVYVSLNRLGNLSNANLEAMRAGVATIFPAAQPADGVDVETDRLLGPETALRIPSVDDRAALAAAIVRLATMPSERQARGRALAAAVQRFAGDWPTRIAREIHMLEDVVAGRTAGGADHRLQP